MWVGGSDLGAAGTLRKLRLENLVPGPARLRGGRVHPGEWGWGRLVGGFPPLPQLQGTPWPGMALVPLRAQVRGTGNWAAASEGAAAGTPEPHAADELLQQTPNSTGRTGGGGTEPHCAAVGGQEGGSHLLQSALPLAQRRQPAGKTEAEGEGAPLRGPNAGSSGCWGSCHTQKYQFLLGLLGQSRLRAAPGSLTQGRSGAEGLRARGSNQRRQAQLI